MSKWEGREGLHHAVIEITLGRQRVNVKISTHLCEGRGLVGSYFDTLPTVHPNFELLTPLSSPKTLRNSTFLKIVRQHETVEELPFPPRDGPQLLGVGVQNASLSITCERKYHTFGTHGMGTLLDQRAR